MPSPGQVEHDHGRGRVERVGGGAVEDAAEVAADEATQRVNEVARRRRPLRGRRAVGSGAAPWSGRVRASDDVADGAGRRGCSATGEGGVEGAVLDGAQVPAQGRLGDRGEQPQPPPAHQRRHARSCRSGGGGPGRAGSAGSAARDRARTTVPPTASATGAHSPFGSPGDVDAAPRGDRAQGEGLRQRGLALADHAGEQHVRVGQRTRGVQRPTGRSRTAAPVSASTPT